MTHARGLKKKKDETDELAESNIDKKTVVEMNEECKKTIEKVK